jgi:unsaturated rhamnogalacturonyl hydrolase
MNAFLKSMNKLRICAALLASVLLLMRASGSDLKTPSSLTNWPAGASPQEVGKRVAENVVARKLDYQTNPKREYVIYPEVCAWYGSLTVAQLSGDKDLQERLIRKFDVFLTPEGAKKISPAEHVDYHVFGTLPLEIYLETKQPQYLTLGQSFADKQWAKTTPDGITAEARYWIDDMYMITAVEVQAYRATGDAKYIDRAALTMAAYLDKLQQPNGLFFHAPDSKFYWGRGNGWVAAGMAELLRSIPADHPKRARILTGYRTMMASLLQYQGPDGLWRQLVDKPASWPETSGTGMFAFAMVSGVKNGWLDAASYGPAARKAWLGLVGELDANANVKEVCAGTNKGFSEQYYIDRPRVVGDLHGQSPILWTASALMR